MTAAGQRSTPRQRFAADWQAVVKFFRGREWMVYSTYVVFAVSILTAAVSRAIGGLKPGELLLILFVALLGLRRVIRRDFSFPVTIVDAAFTLLIAAGTFLPMLTAELRHVYITKDMVSALAGPIEYYLWYRVILEALPLPSQMPNMTKLIIIVASIVSFIGVLQIFKFPGVEKVLLAVYPTYETRESPVIHRATSVVGGWETLAAIAAYTILLINQIQTSEGGIQKLGKWKYWNVALMVMLVFNVIALVSTLSVAGLVAIVVGYLLAWRFNGQLARMTRYVLIIGAVGAVALSPVILQRLAYQKHPAATTATTSPALVAASKNANHFSYLPTTWSSRATHWTIVLKTVGQHGSDILLGVQPSFDYPVLSFGSTESLYLLLLYRGGILYLFAFLGFAFLLCSYIWQQRQLAHGFNRQMLTGILTVLIVNFSIDVLDAHFFSAGEWEILIALIALAVGITTQTDRQMATATSPVAGTDEAARLTAMRTPAVQVPGTWNRRIQFGLMGVLAFTMLASGYGFYKDRKGIAPPTALTVPYYDGTVLSSLENQALGTKAWQLTPNVDTSFIQGYADRVSAVAGESVQLYISTKQPTSYDIAVYRIGWYMGLGGRLFTTQHIAKSQQQGYWTAQDGLQQCARCTTDPTTHLFEANWARSASITIGTAWPTGVYLIKLVAAQGQSYIPLVVRDDTGHEEMLVSLPVSTYQAYNPWGGYSMYGPGLASLTNPMDDTNPNRATQVSFNRPYALGGGAGDLLNYDIHAIRWLERSGYDVSYTTSVDVSAQPASLLLHTTMVSVGHDEYWTKTERDGLEHARDIGINLAFLGANDGYWQARLATDQAGHQNRTLVCYKVATPNSDPSYAWNASMRLTLDPIYRTRPDQTTARWRDPALGRPENTLLGIMYEGTIFSLPPQYTYLPDWSARSGDIDPLEKNASIGPGTKISGGILGYAYDALADNGQTPINLVILGQSTLVASDMQVRIADTTYYRATSGALVFDAGSIWWSWGLDEFTFPGADQPNVLLGNANASSLTTLMLRTMLGAAHVPPPAAQAIQ